MWKICFEDTDEYMDIFFSKKYKEQNTLIYFEEGEAVASLQMLPYTITFYGVNIPFAYLAGLCTLPQHRQKGYMSRLVLEAHKIIAERNIPLAILIPAEDSLYNFYERYGYTQVFDKNDTPIPLNDIITRYKDLQKAYTVFNNRYKDQDFCVQKSVEDFEAIIDDYILDGRPVKTDLSGMGRIILPEALLGLYARANPMKSFTIRLSELNVVYRVSRGKINKEESSSYDIEADNMLLTRLLFGYQIHKLKSSYSTYFEEHDPIINLMLE